MKLAFRVCLALLLVRESLSVCEKGTLKCNLSGAEPVPEVCDFPDSYVLNSETKKCEQKEVEGCELPAFNEASKPCLLCKEKMVFDANNGKCTEVATAIENCSRYVATDSSCSACELNFFLDGGQCVGVTTVVANCAAYSSLTECGACLQEYYLKDAKCEKFVRVENCLVHSDRICDACQAGSVFKPSFMQLKTPTDAVFELIAKESLRANTWAAASNRTACPSNTVQNCAQHETFDKCLKCNEGYFKNDKDQCEKNPEDPIANCELYSGLTTCVKCRGVFYLDGSSAPCVKATEVLNCKSYKVSRDECGECEETHHLDEANNKCMERNHPKIEKCLKLSPVLDECVSCEGGSTLTLDNKRCFENIESCLNLSRAATFEGGQHSCLLCEATHYLENNSCKLRTVPSCKKYQLNSDQCEECDGADKYLSNNKCENVTVTNCAERFPNSNTCKRCNVGFFLLNGDCAPVTVENCVTYHVNTNGCQSCKPGFYPNGDVCSKQNVANCSEFYKDVNRCQKCHAHFYPSQAVSGNGSKCEPQSMANCVKFQDNTNTCTECALAFYWNGSACVSTSRENCKSYDVHTNICNACALGYYRMNDGTCHKQVGSSSSSNCIKFGDNNLTCIACGKGYYKSGDSCVQQSVGNCIVYVDNSGDCTKCAAGYYRFSASECKAQAITGCIRYTENVNQCEECDAGYFKDSAAQCLRLSVTQCIDYNSSTGKCSQCAKGYRLVTSSNSCAEENIANCIKYNASGMCEVCAQATLKTATGDACNALNIDHCVEYDMSTGKCGSCAAGYYKSDASGTSCLPKDKPSCIEYEDNGDCKTCALKFFKSGTGCIAVSKANCIEYTANTNTCTVCDVNYFQTGGSCTKKNVTNCIEYVNNTSGACATCAVGYFLKTASECEKVVAKEKCISYDSSTGKCDKCDFGYYLDASKACVSRTKANCIKYVGQTNDCETCQIGYYVSDAFCKLQNKPNCIDYQDNVNVCTTCEKGYYKDGSDNCQMENKDYCIEYNTNGTCKVCQAGYFEDSGTCRAQTMSGCIKFTANKAECMKCSPDYYKSGTTCVHRNVTGCIEYEADSGDCKTCANNFHKASASSCLEKNTAGCLEYTGATCTKCAMKKYLHSDNTCMDQSVDNCSVYTDNKNECTTCAAGYYRKTATECEAAAKTNCIEFTPNTDTCIKCAAGSYLDTGDSSCKPQTTVSGCIEYQSNVKTCLKCQLGKYIDSSECKDQSLDNCITYKFNENKCEVCESGFYRKSDETCEEQNVTNCIEYTPNSEVCKTCATGYYLKYNADTTPTFSCALGNIENCAKYEANANICSECDQRYFLDGVNCEAKPAWDSDTANSPSPEPSGCIEWKSGDSTEKKCAKCVQLKKLSANELTCEPIMTWLTLEACIKHSTTMVTVCELCNEGFKLSSSNGCEPVTTIANCLKYVEGEQKCEKCATTHKPSTDATACEANTNIINCVDYVDGDLTTCTKCSNLSYLTGSDKTCSDITSKNNCIESNGTTDACTKCKPGFFNPAGGCSASRTAALDTECMYNTQTTNNPICDKCNAGFFGVDAQSRSTTTADLDSKNCLALKGDESTVKCNQCKEWHQLESSGDCTEITENRDTLKCKVKSPGSITALTDGSECDTCSFNNLFNITGGSCVTRGDLINSPNCEEYLTDAAGCKTCKTGFSAEDLGYKSTCVDALTGSAVAIANCAIYKTVDTTAECEVCEQGYKNNTTTCMELESNKSSNPAPTKKELVRGYDNKLSPIASVETATDFANCERFTQINGSNAEASIGCSKCKDTFVGIVDYDTSDNATHQPAGYVEAANSHSGRSEVMNTFSKCMDGTKSYLKADDTKLTADNTCAVGYQDGNNDGFTCLRCKNGFKGKIGEAAKLSASEPLSATFRGIGGCVDASSAMERKFDFMHYRYRTKKAALRWNSLLTFDSCVYNEGSGTPEEEPRNMVYMSYLDETNGHLTRTEHKDTATSSALPIDEVFCLKDSRFAANNLITNCQFYLLDGNLTGDINSTMQIFTVTCGMCKPGHLPNNFEGKITSCTAIDVNNCDVAVPSTNTWMNACAVPKHTGWKWNTTLTPNRVDYHVPVDSTKKLDNCVAVLEGTPSKCKVCEAGFDVNNGNCVITIPLGDSCELKMGITDFPAESDASNQQLQFNNLVILRYKVSATYKTLVHAGCNKCKDSKILHFNVTDTSQKVCTATTLSVAGCSLYDGTQANKCSVCTAGKALHKTNLTCHDIGSDTNCTETTDGTSCSGCKATFALKGTTCTISNCKAHEGNDNKNDCLVCNDNFPLDSNEKKVCGSTAATTPDCVNFSPKLGHCVKHKDGHTIYAVYTKGSSETFRIARFEPTANVFSAAPLTSLYKFDYPYVKVVVDLKDTAKPDITSTVSYVNTVEQSVRIYDTSLTNKTTNHCFKKIAVATISADCNDSSDDNNHGAVCLVCKDTKVMALDGTCAAFGTQTECLVGYFKNDESTELCLKCKTTHYPDANKACQTRNADYAAGCEVVNEEEDKCVTCNENMYITNNVMCSNNSQADCKVKSRLENKCLICNIGHYRSTTAGTCTAYTVQFCETYHRTENKCVKCEYGFKKTSSDGCEAKVAKLCLTFDPAGFSTDDLCATCQDTHMLDSGTTLRHCIPKTVKNCLTYQTTGNMCASCTDGFYLNGGECKKKTSRKCLTFVAGFAAESDKCLTCSDAFKTDTVSVATQTICSKKTAANCKTFAAGDDDKCATCLGTMVLDSTAGTCTPKPIDLCLTFFMDSTTNGQKDICGSCTSLFWKNSISEKCQPKTAKRCATFHATKDQCLTCGVGMKLDSTPKHCENKTANFCKTWDSAEDKCATCESALYYKGSSDASCTLNTGTSCEAIKTEANGCSTCKVGWYSDGLNCTRSNATLCKSFKANMNQCQDCEPDFKLDSSPKSCIPKTALKCLSFSASEDRCSTCKNGFVLSSNNANCEKQTSDNCLTWNNTSHECESCAKLWTLNNEKTACELKTLNNCKTMNATLSKCDSCEAGYLLNANTGNCDLNLARNCLQPSTTEHKCATCPANFLKNAESSCDPNEGSNCKVVDDTQKGCKSCALGFHLNSSNRDCDKATKTNCLTYKSDATTGAVDECDTCSIGFYKSGGNCLSKTATMCENFAAGDSNQCATCKIGFNLDSGNCAKNTASNCKTWKASMNECEDCAGFFFKSGTSCTKQTASLCKTFKTGVAGCQDCEAEHTLNGASSCVRNSGANCATWKSDGTGCETCSQYFFKETNACKAKSGTDCKTYKADGAGCATCSSDYTISGVACTKTAKANCDGFKSGADECNACSADFFMFTDKSCKRNSGENCLSYNAGSDGCSTCESGFVKDGLNCTGNTAKNCKTFNAGAHTCSECEALYTNQGGVCVANNATYCTSFDPSSHSCVNCALGWYKDGASCMKVTAEKCLTFQQNLNRCATCILGFVFNSTSFLCEANSAENCAGFKANEHKCETCLTGYFKDSSGICQKHTVTCKDYNASKNECTSCKEGFWLDGSNICQTNTAANCATRSQTVNQCLSCVDKFWINTANNNVCTAHTATGCLKYHQTKNECIECLTTVLTTVESTGKVVCTAYSALNCDGFHKGSDECLKCASDSYGTETAGKLQCTKRANTTCVTYQSDKDECTSCAEAHFMNQAKQCVESTVVEFCSTYETESDQCKVCKENYYKDSGSNVCKRFPDGVANCKEYTSRRQCKYCKVPFYLETNTCLPVLKTIAGCLRYYSATHCHSCEVGKLLVENECRTITASNCDLYLDEATCLTCAGNFVLQDNRTCQASGIVNCKRALKGTSSNVCAQCEKGYFLSEDKIKCEAPTTPIANCHDYEDQTTCKECADNFIRSVDKKACTAIGSLAGANCRRARFTAEAVCDECYFGFNKTLEGGCSAIPVKSCYLASEDNSSCVLCATRSYMDKDGQCQGEGLTGSGPGNPTDGGPNSELILSLKLWSLLLMLLSTRI